MEEVAEEAKLMGYPMLNVLTQNYPPSLISKTYRLINIITKEPYEHLTPAEVNVIAAVVSSANGCEMWLSFHASALTQMAAMSEEDLDNLVAGGVPKTEKLNGENGRLHSIAVAAKVAIAHKGIILPNEMKHLEALGIDLGHELAEIQFIAANTTGSNSILSHFLNQNPDVVEDFLRKAGPFKNTVYK